MILISYCSCLCPIHWSQVWSREWRCSWSSADRRCSNYIWVINNFIALSGAPYIRGLTVTCLPSKYIAYCPHFFQSLSPKQRDHQERIWEILRTEVQYIKKLQAIDDVSTWIQFAVRFKHPLMICLLTFTIAMLLFFFLVYTYDW